MPYVVLKDGATVPKDTGTRYSIRDRREFRATQATVYAQGDYLADSEVAQPVKDAYEAGKPNVLSLIKEVSQEEYDEAPDSVKADDIASRFQAEGGGDVDEPRKVSTAITRLDAERNPALKAVQEASVAQEDSSDEDESEPDDSKSKKTKTKAKK